MSQFAQSGSAGDDAIGEDVDRGFFSINQRLQLNQLQEGEVRESLNGRMEGYWKPRKGIVEKTTALTTGQPPLQLPFYLVGSSVLITAASVTGGIVTLTTASAHGLVNGSTLNIAGIKYTTGTDPNGVFTATTASGSSITYPLVGGVGPYTVSAVSPVSEVITSTSKAISNVTIPATGTVRLTVTGHGFAAGTSGWATIAGLDASFNGSYKLAYFNANSLDYTIAGVTTPPTVKIGTLSQMVINDVANANVRASCIFSDPNTNNKEYVIVAMDTVAKKIDLATFAVTDIPYLIGQALGANTEMIQVFDKVMLFRDGQQALEWYPNGRPILSASQSGTATVIARVRDHGLAVGASVIISGLTGGTPANGTFTVISIIDEDSFTYTFTTSQTQVFNIDAATMTDGFTLSPGGKYTQPQVFNANGLAVTSLDGLVTISVENNITLQKGNVVSVYECTIPEFAPLIGKQLYITNASLTELQFYAPVPNFTQDIVSASQIQTTVTAIVKGHGFAVGESISVTGITGINGGTMPNGPQTVTSVTGDSFTYTATAALAYYTITTPLNVTATTWISTGVLQITIPAHGFTGTGWADLSGYTGANSYLNKSHQFTKHSNDELRFNIAGVSSVLNQTAVLSQMKYDFTTSMATAIEPARDQLQIEVGGQFSVGGGFMHQPGAPWGIAFQRRLWVPYYYDQSGPYDAVTYTNRKITDEISVSDILDTTTFDQIENQFRISGGTADYVVGMHGFYDDALIVLNRNSLHIVKGTLGSLLDITVKELTSEIGCLARRSIVMRGNMMMFLSDDGVYGVEFLNDYNLRGAEEPISKNIQPYIDRINKDYADKSVGVLFDNRYYLAVPLDSIIGANDARGNNSILVFNFLNKGWESLDTFGDSRFLIENFVLGGAGTRNNIYAVTANGGLHQLEAVDSSVDRLNVSNVGGELVTPTINSMLITRGYDLGTMERKRFTDAQIVMQNLPGGTGEYNISFTTEDPDTYEQIVDRSTGLRKSVQDIGTTSKFLGGQVLSASPDAPNEAETAGIRCRLGGIRGYTGTMILTRTIGSPKVNSIKVAGSVTNRQILSQK